MRIGAIPKIPNDKTNINLHLNDYKSLYQILKIKYTIL